MLSKPKHLGFERENEILHSAALCSDAVLNVSKE